MRRGRTNGAVAAALSMSVLLGLVTTGGVASAASVPVSSKPLVVYRSCVLTAYPASTTVAIDSYVDQHNSGTNYGTATTLSVRSQNNSYNRRTFVEFDQTKCSPSIPSGATVTNATLGLYVSSLPGACRTYDLYRVTRSSTQWVETGTGSITWDNAPAVVTNATSSATVGASSCGGTGVAYVSWDVTADVALFVSGTNNRGWMIRDHTESSSTTYTATFSAKNLGTLAQSPQLVMTYLT